MTPAQEVIQAHRDYMAAHDAADLATILQLVHPDCTYFHVTADLKGEAGDPAVLKAIYEGGYSGNLRLHHNEAQVYGNSAVVTCYLSGQINWMGGHGSVTGSWRYTSVWVKVDGQWKIVHIHASPLAPIHTSS